MAKLKNSMIEKLVSEGRVKNSRGPDLTEKNKELYYKQKQFECANYKAGYYSRKVVLTAN